MTANGRGNMRPSGRSPPFLAIGLFVALVILGFNYWSLSARNGEQANEIVLMESELRLVNAKKTSAEKRMEATSDKIEDLEKQLNEQKELLANKAAELANVEREKETFGNRVNELETELKTYRDEKLPKCEAEKQALTTQVDELKTNVEFHKNKPCEESACTEYVKSARDATLKDIFNVSGANPLIRLYNAKGNLGSYTDQIAKMAEQINQQQLAAGQNNQGQGQNDAPVNPANPVNQPEAPKPNQGNANIAQATGENDPSKQEDSNVKVDNEEEAKKDGAGAKGRTEGKEPGRGGIEGNYDGDKMPDEADEQYDEDEDVDDDTLRVNDKEDKEDNDYAGEHGNDKDDYNY